MSIKPAPSKSLIEGLKDRVIPQGGFALFSGGGYRPDATAWAIIGLRSAGAGGDLISSGRDRLAREQLPDGRVVMSPDAPGVFWVTALAALAWAGSGRYSDNMNRAVDFLADTSGRHWQRQEKDPAAHETSIRGWPWTEDAHSWVAPTSYGVLALRVAGKGRHPRTVEAARMLMDRQLAAGGWNYGNTSVFGRRQYPQPDLTGLALSALRPYVSREDVSVSLDYLGEEIGRIGTPLSLGWGLLGLGAWGAPPEGFIQRIGKCIDRRKVPIAYNTQELSLLLAALSADPWLLEDPSRK